MTPRNPVLARVGADEPATIAGVPVRVHRPEVSIFKTKVEDEPLCTLAVRREELAELGDRGLGFVTKFGHDGTVD